jgi:hypothetical protein
MKAKLIVAVLLLYPLIAWPIAAAGPDDGSVLPFPPVPMESVIKPRLQDSTMKWPAPPQRLPKDAPNILIILIDDVGFGVAETFGGEVGRFVDGLQKRGLRENTLIFYIWGDNGSSAEGQQGSISELLAQNNIPNTVDQQLAALERLGGLKALGSPKTDNIYNDGWMACAFGPFIPWDTPGSARRIATWDSTADEWEL